MLSCLTLLLISSAALAFDSRDIPSSEFLCGDGSLSALFSDGSPANCDAEVLRPIALTMPIVTYYDAAAAPGSTYTLLAVDPDAPNASLPIRGPIRHAAFARLSQRLLREGVSWSTLASNNDSAIALFNYSGPGPSAGSGCHRYYLMLYLEDQAAPVPNLDDFAARVNFNFPAFASKFSLVKIPRATTYWRTQNYEARSGPCDVPRGTTPSNGSLAYGLGFGLPAAFIVFAIVYRSVNSRDPIAAGSAAVIVSNPGAKLIPSNDG
jgi:hypothetical protein